jgi:hypothetical protein
MHAVLFRHVQIQIAEVQMRPNASVVQELVLGMVLFVAEKRTPALLLNLPANLKVDLDAVIFQHALIQIAEVQMRPNASAVHPIASLILITVVQQTMSAILLNLHANLSVEFQHVLTQIAEVQTQFNACAVEQVDQLVVLVLTVVY